MTQFNLKSCRLVSAALTMAIAMSVAFTTHADELAPGSTVMPVPEVEVGGTEVYSVTDSFVADNLTGTLTSTVLSGDPFNLLGGLTFTYALVLDEGNHSLSRLTVSSFGSVGADVGQVSPGATVYASTRGSDGKVVGFNFPFGIGLPAGESSTLLVVRTDSALYADTLASVINGSQSSVASVAPEVIPEPASSVLLLAGGAALLGFCRRKR